MGRWTDNGGNDRIGGKVYNDRGWAGNERRDSGMGRRRTDVMETVMRAGWQQTLASGVRGAGGRVRQWARSCGAVGRQHAKVMETVMGAGWRRTLG